MLVVQHRRLGRHGFTFALGIVAAILSGDRFASSMVFTLTAGLIREWSFGFPQLILQPPVDSQGTATPRERHPLIGVSGVAISPLRPTGDVRIEGKKLTALSENGQIIEMNSPIIVTGCRNGRLLVRVKQRVANYKSVACSDQQTGAARHWHHRLPKHDAPRTTPAFGT